jgi:Lon protease-like protein
MFPLGTVLFPHAPLPLHVFEPRYRELAETCLRGDGRFGVVLIERGREVGGGDSRFSVGTVARIIEAARTPDGRYLLATEGTERLRVRKWLSDDPYPRAEVETLSEPKRTPPRAIEQRDAVELLLARVLALAGELGHRGPGPEAAVLDSDPIRASFEAAAKAPIGPLDAQRLLELDDPSDRFEQLEKLLHDEVELMQFRLGNS